MALIGPEMMQKYGNALLNADFQFARSMPTNPHWYTLKKNWKDKQLFDEVVLASRAYGYTEWFGGAPWQMFNVNDRKYWTCMGEIDSRNAWSTILINMKPRGADTSNPYDEIAHQYDSAWLDEESKAEERDVMEIIGDLSGKSVLDIGCGTGLLFDYHEPTLESYVGIDPSGPMLQVFKQRHPGLGEEYKLIQCNFEEYAGPRVDVAICLFGSAAYISREYMEGIRHYLKPGGRFIIMATEEGYTPVTYERLGIYQDFTGGILDLPGDIQKINHYYVQTGTV